MSASSGLTVGIIGCGEMGAAVGKALRADGARVLTVLDGRGEETRRRAAEAGLEEVSGLEALVAESDVLFSIVPPAGAREVAEQVAKIAGANARAPVFVEANAVSPALVGEMAALFGGTAVRFVDGGIVGQPPDGEKRPRLYWSGAQSPELESLEGAAFELFFLGPEPGRASGFKMAYAAITKGTNALLTAALLLAERMGLLDAYLAEIEESQPALAKRAEANVARLPADAGRWVFEMEQIRDTFAAHGLPGGFHQGAADIMALLAASPYGSETRRTRDRSRTMRATVETVAGGIGK